MALRVATDCQALFFHALFDKLNDCTRQMEIPLQIFVYIDKHMINNSLPSHSWNVESLNPRCQQFNRWSKHHSNTIENHQNVFDSIFFGEPFEQKIDVCTTLLDIYLTFTH